jgi:RNA polymerase sigma-70 factor, ECF subfamily
VTSAELADPGARLLGMYDRALPQVYGYLRARVGGDALAEDLTADTFLAAVQAVRKQPAPDLTMGWLVTVARNKLVDHWRRTAREERGLRIAAGAEADGDEDAGAREDERFERMRAREVLAELGAHHRAALALRYLDGLPVAEVAEHLGRTVHATEALLVRARRAFRVRYAEGSCDE